MRIVTCTIDNSDSELKRAIKENRPLLIKGLVADSVGDERSDKWSPEFVLSLLGEDKQVLTPLRETPLNTSTIDFEEITKKPKSFGEIISDCIDPEDPDKEIYVPGMKTNFIPSIKDVVGKLDALRSIKLARNEIFLGRNTQCVGHFHAFFEAILCQFKGQKHIRLYSPSSFRKLSPFPALSHHYLRSKINFYQNNRGEFPNLSGIDEDAHPKSKDAEYIDIVLEPGDAIYIPVHWLHVLQGKDWNLSVAHFWDSEIKNWKFNYPALISCLNKPLVPLRRLKTYLVRKLMARKKQDILGTRIS